MRNLSEEIKKAKKQKEACKDLTADGMQKIYAPIQHAAENCNSDNQTMMVKLQDFMGQYNSYVSGASDQIKQANQTSLKLAKRE